MENYQEFTDMIEGEKLTDKESLRITFSSTMEAINDNESKENENTELIKYLKENTKPPIQGVETMQILEESDALKKIINSLYEISDQRCKDGLQNHLVMENITRQMINSKLTNLMNDGESIDQEEVRGYLYKMLSDNTTLYEEILSKIGGPFILGVNDRGNRGGSESWGIHMGVDYNLPKGTPIKAISGGIVVAKRSGRTIDGDPIVKKHLEAIYKSEGEKDSKLDNILIIEHTTDKGQKFYSLYVHITDNNFQVGSEVKTGQEIGKIDGYETNGQWQPHLHFTIMTNLDNRPMLSGYLNDKTSSDDEKEILKGVAKDEKPQKLQELYDTKYGKDMINPIDIYM